MSKYYDCFSSHSIFNLCLRTFICIKSKILHIQGLQSQQFVFKLKYIIIIDFQTKVYIIIYMPLNDGYDRCR